MIMRNDCGGLLEGKQVFNELFYTEKSEMLNGGT